MKTFKNRIELCLKIKVPTLFWPQNRINRSENSWISSRMGECIQIFLYHRTKYASFAGKKTCFNLRTFRKISHSVSERVADGKVWGQEPACRLQGAPPGGSNFKAKCSWGGNWSPRAPKLSTRQSLEEPALQNVTDLLKWWQTCRSYKKMDFFSQIFLNRPSFLLLFTDHNFFMRTDQERTFVCLTICAPNNKWASLMGFTLEPRWLWKLSCTHLVDTNPPPGWHVSACEQRPKQFTLSLIPSVYLIFFVSKPPHFKRDHRESGGQTWTRQSTQVLHT